MHTKNGERSLLASSAWNASRAHSASRVAEKASPHPDDAHSNSNAAGGELGKQKHIFVNDIIRAAGKRRKQGSIARSIFRIV